MGSGGSASEASLSEVASGSDVLASEITAPPDDEPASSRCGPLPPVPSGAAASFHGVGARPAADSSAGCLGCSSAQLVPMTVSAKRGGSQLERRSIFQVFPTRNPASCRQASELR